MSDQQRTTNGTGVATIDGPTPRPALLRSIAHRLAGEPAALPVVGSLASFDGATGWLNSEPLTPEALKGRVVLVDFWTYTCINWLRTLPYVRAWDDKYRDAGLTVVGVHTPEFGFERDVDNITASLGWFDVRYPIAVDGNYGVWRAFDNHFWPAVYLADVDGQIRFQHFGEGEYAATEMAIQQLLMESGAEVDQELVMVDPKGLEVSADWRDVQSPESYTAFGRGYSFVSEERGAFGRPQEYSIDSLRLNEFGLAGNWTIDDKKSVSNEPGGRVAFRFHGRDVNLVMGPAAKGSALSFRVYVDGELAGSIHGADLSPDGRGVLDQQRTYQLIRQAGPITDRTFEIEFAEAGAEVYCFTFG
jgi:thiol-disulfide isomerase/thioredoxin